MLKMEVFFMKKNWLITAGLLSLLLLPCLTLAQENAVRQNREATIWQDLYYHRQEKKDLIISSDDKVQHTFYGLQIGDKKSDTLKKLRPAFKFMYELKAIGNEYLMSDVVYPDYYLTVLFDENDRVFMIIYQENQKYELL